MDLGTGLTVLGGALGSAKLLEKILGPTADYLGTGTKDWTQKGVDNLKRIFQRSEEVLGERIEMEGQVPPKVLKSILNNGQFCEDEVSTAYFGGILASSRSNIKSDDRAITYLRLLEGMSNYQIRSHYIFYGILKQIYIGSTISMTRASADASLWIDYESYVTSMLIKDQGENIIYHSEGKSYDNIDNIFIHSMHGLRRLNLIDHFVSGGVKLLSKKYLDIPSPGVVFQPSPVGVELFLWANGMSKVSVNDFLNSSIQVKLDSDIALPSNVKKVERRPERKRKRDALGLISRKERI